MSKCGVVMSKHPFFPPHNKQQLHIILPKILIISGASEAFSSLRKVACLC